MPDICTVCGYKHSVLGILHEHVSVTPPGNAPQHAEARPDSMADMPA
jgi:hypothetical protein